MLVELNTAREEAGRLAVQCVDAGLSIEKRTESPSEKHHVLQAVEQLPLPPGIITAPSLIARLIGKDREESETILGPVSRIQRRQSLYDEGQPAISEFRHLRIQDWLGTVPTEPATPHETLDITRFPEQARSSEAVSNRCRSRSLPSKLPLASISHYLFSTGLEFGSQNGPAGPGMTTDVVHLTPNATASHLRPRYSDSMMAHLRIRS